MLKKIYIFRHGETDWNAQERFQGHIDVPLNENGRSQAAALIDPLRASGIQAILSSDLSRAYETAQIIAHALQIPVIKDPDLREAHLGHAQGMTREEIEAQFGLELARRWRSWHVSDADISYPEGETGSAIMERVFRGMERFLVSEAYSVVGIASHGGVIRRIMQKILPPGSEPVPIPNGVLYQLGYELASRAWSVIDGPHKSKGPTRA